MLAEELRAPKTQELPTASAGVGKSEKGRKDHNIVRKVKGLWQKVLPQKEECGRGKGTPVARANRKHIIPLSLAHEHICKHCTVHRDTLERNQTNVAAE